MVLHSSSVFDLSAGQIDAIDPFLASLVSLACEPVGDVSPSTALASGETQDDDTAGAARSTCGLLSRASTHDFADADPSWRPSLPEPAAEDDECGPDVFYARFRSVGELPAPAACAVAAVLDEPTFGPCIAATLNIGSFDSSALSTASPEVAFLARDAIEAEFGPAAHWPLPHEDDPPPEPGLETDDETAYDFGDIVIHGLQWE